VSELKGPLASTGYWLKVTALAYLRELDAALRPLGLTNAQFAVLVGASWLGKEGTPPAQQQVADFAGADRMMTSKLLQGLEKRKLVKRVASITDARVRHLELTPAGRWLVTASTAAAREVDRRVFGTDMTLRDLLMMRAEEMGAAGQLASR
jgi:DNA-binding MarR family transcriptional regulator